MSPGRNLYFLILLFVFCGFLGSLLIMGLQYLMGIDPYSWQQSINEHSDEGLRNSARLFAFLNNLSSFLVPALICAYFVARKRWFSFLKLDVFSKPVNLIWSILILLVSIPLIQYTYSINRALPLPEWMGAIETSTEVFIRGLLKTDYAYEFWLNMVLFAVIPALGEELFFRGMMQQLFQKWFRSPQVAIWTTALVFSAIHFQFQGFIPRFLLGGILGYVFYLTGSLWMSVLGHFTNNALMVVSAHLFATGKLSVDLEKQEFPLQAGIVSLGITIFILYLLERSNTDRLQTIDNENGSSLKN
jgi:membrane protease YdiL (CAAX protease family)